MHSLAQVRGLSNLSPQFFLGTCFVFVGFLLAEQAERSAANPDGSSANGRGLLDGARDGEEQQLTDARLGWATAGMGADESERADEQPEAERAAA